ncbi:MULTISPECIES: hypothetical protein [Actinomadura]|uniref:Uncharacterized protein n=1 Tax=Actinomadura yumaensis TaxID=111807 RepID=A0ABW2CKK0_9ACTN|nr:hypothetical protein [Actinomadura sp. J1-007]
MADELGLSYEALMKRRRRAEYRLVTAITSGDRSCKRADVQSRLLMGHDQGRTTPR